MKYAGVLFVLIASLVLVSCSNLDQENPISSQIQKPIVDSFDYPYEYLTGFESVPVKQYFSFNDAIRVITSEVPFSVEQVFAVVKYSPNPDVDFSTSVLLFLGNPKTNEFTIPVLGDREILGVRIYALPQRNIPDLVTNYPYEYLQSFKALRVNNWSSSGQLIKITAEEVENVAQTFAEFTYKDGNILVYLDKPASGTFEIPKYGDMGVTEINLFGYTGPEDQIRLSDK